MKYPYANSIPGLNKVINQLRSSFPSTITIKSLQSWQIAQGNEKYILAVLVFLGLIDQSGNKVSDKAKMFLLADDEFKTSLRDLVHEQYSDIFQQFGDPAWTLSVEKLIPYFRGTDESTLIVGRRQANTFIALTGLCGVREVETKIKKTRVVKGSAIKPSKKANPEKPSSDNSADTKDTSTPVQPSSSESFLPKKSGVTMQSPNITVRIELNLPITNDQSVYDKLFKSIKENLLINNV